MIENIVFDLGNVIANFDPYAIYYNFTNNKEEALELYNLLYVSNIWEDLDKGEQLTTIIDKLQLISPPKYHQPIETIIYNWYKELTIDLEMEELIKDLKHKNYNIYMLSNISKQFYDFKTTTSLFDIFDGLYVSADSKLIKPNPEIYIDFLTKFKLEPYKTIFIDDKIENILAAKQLGIHTFHYQDNIDYLKDYLTHLLVISFDTK